MKYRNKHYLAMRHLPLVLIPVIALTILGTLLIDQRVSGRFPYKFEGTVPDFDKDKISAYGDPPDIDGEDCEKAIFDFTGDTVLMLKGSDLLTNPPGRRKVIYKTKQGTLATIEVPQSQLTEISGDTSSVKE
ncbi:hypothetical protein KHS38_14160 [Mucilaginibacter sp. Bleaf8]|uniref:hypothetical protein n=1 Tax=Mucilaginibacter sp. Bleaf8 TaxID=2834430 RepID=UPI001BCC5D02|nr:hypothetical protein [Mucilaginibacter sp. Bleaf8]MBS7565553.1 hypothetical protein [Mucilaginibacter sp. Bleaf8]